jgi:Zn-dependent protease
MNISDTISSNIAPSNHQVQLNLNLELQILDNIRFEDQNSSRFVLIDKTSSKIILISKEEAFVWLKLKKDPNFPEAMYAFYQSFKTIPASSVYQLLRKWENLGIIQEQVNVYKSIKQKICSRSIFARIISTIIKLFTFLFNLQVELPFLSKFINFSYKYIKFIFMKPIRNAFLVIATIGFVTLNLKIATKNFSYPIIALDATFLTIGVLILASFSIAIHELAHGYLMVRFGKKVKKSGLRFFLLFPVLYIDTTDIWAKSRSKRILTSSAGIMANFMMAGLAFLFAQFLDTSFIKLILYKLAFINMLNTYINLIPFVALDGYYILIDLLYAPNLIERSFEQLLNILKGQKQIRPHLLAFALVSTLSHSILLAYSLNIIDKIFFSFS